ncbi:hypothetical protein C8F01DRAFT_662590 [Mycena amicta]|nr:hypothetical protein C8F01DRAFT_662590 [Mycena amicta]
MESSRALRRSRHPSDSITSAQLALALQQPSSVAGPGRTIWAFYCNTGQYVGRHANKLAHHFFGLGPLAVCDQVQALMGDGLDREATIKQLSRSELECKKLQKLEQRCSKLLKYALPSEAASTQIDAFKIIMSLTTQYPGLRSIFLNSRRMRIYDHSSKQALVDLWSRKDVFGAAPILYFIETSPSRACSKQISL